jgi:hypothetical protein
MNAKTVDRIRIIKHDRRKRFAERPGCEPFPVWKLQTPGEDLERTSGQMARFTAFQNANPASFRANLQSLPISLIRPRAAVPRQ